MATKKKPAKKRWTCTGPKARGCGGGATVVHVHVHGGTKKRATKPRKAAPRRRRAK